MGLVHIVMVSFKEEVTVEQVEGVSLVTSKLSIF
jgi:hypothetical protein